MGAFHHVRTLRPLLRLGHADLVGYLCSDDGDPMVPLFRVMFHDVFTNPDDPADVMEGYERRLAEVRAEIEPERLVEWQPGDGWEPICRALDAPLPDRPFPHKNTTADFLSRAEAQGGGS